jgi:hypothetical protein
VIWLAPRHVDKTSAPGSGVPSCKLTAWAEMLAFNDHPARRWEPERLGLLLFSIAARITSHAWRTYYGFPTRTLAHLLAAALARLQALPSPT